MTSVMRLTSACDAQGFADMTFSRLPVLPSLITTSRVDNVEEIGWGLYLEETGVKTRHLLEEEK